MPRPIVVRITLQIEGLRSNLMCKSCYNLAISMIWGANVCTDVQPVTLGGWMTYLAKYFAKVE